MSSRQKNIQLIHTDAESGCCRIYHKPNLLSDLSSFALFGDKKKAALRRNSFNCRWGGRRALNNEQGRNGPAETVHHGGVPGGTASGLAWCAAETLSAGMLRLRERRGIDGLRHSAQMDGAGNEDVCRTATRVERDRAREGQAELSTGQGISHHN